VLFATDPYNPATTAETYHRQLDEVNTEIKKYRNVQEFTGTDRTNWVGAIMHLADALEARHSLTGQLSDLNEAISLYRTIFSTLPPSVEKRNG